MGHYASEMGYEPTWGVSYSTSINDIGLERILHFIVDDIVDNMEINNYKTTPEDLKKKLKRKITSALES